MIVPIVIAASVGALAWKHSKKKGMTPERKKVFEAAMRSLRDPAKLEALADAFCKEGLKAECKELQKRANLMKLSQSNDPKAKAVLAGRKVAFKKAMGSKDPGAIKKVAAAFHNMGHYESAAKLRNYAKGLFHTSGSVKVGAEEGFASSPGGAEV